MSKNKSSEWEKGKQVGSVQTTGSSSWCGNGGDGAASGLTVETVFIEESSLGGKGAEMKCSGQRRWKAMPNLTEKSQGCSWDGKSGEEELVWGEGCGLCLGPTECEMSTGG